jgi:hypothetical protein
MAEGIYLACKNCLSINGVSLLLGLLLLIAGATSIPAVDRGRLPPMPGRELPSWGHAPDPFAQAVVVFLQLVNFSSFQWLFRRFMIFLRTAILMHDRPPFWRSFWRYVNIYYLFIVLPAAFMPPVSHPQRSADFHLLFAVVLLICINALGDAIAIRVTLRTFEKLKFEQVSFPIGSDENFWSGVRNEVRYYGTVLKVSAYSAPILISVLALSSVLFAVQIGELDFGLTTRFFAGAWDRMTRFPELFHEPYWFRDRPGPFGSAGIPGLFLYAFTTFAPVIALFCLALAWLALLPFRIAVNLPTNSRTVRIVSAECVAVVLCVVVRATIGI